MRRPATVAAAGLLSVATLATSCEKQGDSVVVVDVDVDPGVTGVVQIRAFLSNGGAGEGRRFPTAPASSPLALPTAFSVTLARSRGGALDVALDALGAGGEILGNGADTVALAPGGRAELHVLLHAGASLCGNGAVDPGEQCDDGDRISSGTCDFRCARRSATSGSGGAPGDASSGDAPERPDRPGGGGGGGGAGAGGGGGARVDAATDRGCSVELLANGAFDAGDVGWTADSTAGRALIYRDDDPALVAAGVTPVSPHDLAWLGGDVLNEAATLSQQVLVPTNAVTLTASGSFHIVTAETDTTTVYDAGHIELVRGTVVTPVLDWSNQDANAGWAPFSADVDAVLLRGNTLTFQLRATTDDGLATDFFLDDVSFSAKVCP